MKQRTDATRPQLDRTAWIDAALDILAEEGVGGVRVEVLAKKLGVTKGSFYWHFQDRQDLLSALLEQWREGRIRDILKQTRAEPGKALERIYHVIDVYSSARNRKGMRIELAMRDWARHAAQAAQVVAEVESTRLESAQRLFVEAGIPEEEAATRSMLLYAYVFGQSLMSGERFSRDIGAAKSWIADRIAR